MNKELVLALSAILITLGLSMMTYSAFKSSVVDSYIRQINESCPNVTDISCREGIFHE